MAATPDRGEGGFSLLELTIVTMILTLVMAVAMSGLVSAQRTSQADGDRVLNLNQARLLMDWTTRDFHTAVVITVGTPAFVTALPFEAKFTGTLDTVTAPVLIRFYVSGSQLIEQLTQADAGTAPAYTFTGTAANRYVAQYISNSTTAPTQPIFTYLDGTNAPIVASPAGSALTSAQLLQIHAVQIDYWVRHASVFSVNATELKSRASLPNLDYNPNGSYST
jgi:type II secretory pathway pseudopilin PulG